MSSDDERSLLGEDHNQERDTHESEAGMTTAATTASEAEVLIIKDCDPWGEAPNEAILSEMGVSYRIVESNNLENESVKGYSVVLIPSSQPESYYEILAEESSKLDSYVADGGTLIAHTMFSGYPCGAGLSLEFMYLPGGVEIEISGRRNQNRIVDEDHPLFEDLSDADFNRPEVSYNELMDLPDSSSVLLESEYGEDVYVEYHHGDGTVLATGNPMEGAWLIDDHGTPKQFLHNELKYALEAGPIGTEISASLTTLQFIPGKEENPSQGGDPLYSGLMQIFPEDGESWTIYGAALEAAADPVFDSWLGGDMIDELPGDLDRAREKKRAKYADDAGPKSFKQYRFENGLMVSFETPDGREIDKDSINIQFSEAGPSGSDSRVSRGEQENSRTVLHRDTEHALPVDEWYDSNDRRSRREPRYYKIEDDCEFDGVEGVRVVTLWGGWAGFMADVSDRASSDPAGFLADIWDWDYGSRLLDLALSVAPEEVHTLLEVLLKVPRNFTFLDFIVLADGRRYARVWDASQYPSLYTYLDGDLKAKDDMWYRPTEQFNPAMVAFHLRAIEGFTPYTFDPVQYEWFLTGQIEDYYDDPWTPAYEEKVRDFIDRFGLDEDGWTVDELLPTMPRETLGYYANGDPIDNPGEPFPDTEDLNYPTDDKLPPN